MKVIIAGSRTLKGDMARRLVIDAVAGSGFKITEVVSGCADGIDKAGEQWAEERGIPVKRMPADWEKWGKSAGPIRNGQMAEYADALVAIHNGSKGTMNMIEQAKKRGLPIYEVTTGR